MKKGTKVNVKSINKNGVVISSSNNRVSIMMEDGTAKVFDANDVEMLKSGGQVKAKRKYAKGSTVKGSNYRVKAFTFNDDTQPKKEFDFYAKRDSEAQNKLKRLIGKGYYQLVKVYRGDVSMTFDNGKLYWDSKAKGSTINEKKKTNFTISEYIKFEKQKLREHNAKAHEDDRLDWSDWKSELTSKDTKEYGIFYNSIMLDSNGDRGVFEYLPENKNYTKDEYAKGSTIKGNKQGNKYGLGGFLAGAAIGAGATYYLSNTSKRNSKDINKPKEVVKQVKEVKQVKLSEKDKNIVSFLWSLSKEGFDYGIREYSDFKNLKDTKFDSLRKVYVSDVNKLESHISKRTDSPDEIDIDKEGIEYGFLSGEYNDWKKVKDAKFQALLKSAKASYNNLQKHIKATYKIKSFSEDDLRDRAIDLEDGVNKYAKGGNAIEEMSIKEGMGAGKKTWVVSHPKVQEKGVYFQDEYSQDEAKNEFYENVLKTYKYAKGGDVSKESIYKEWLRFRNGRKGGSPHRHAMDWARLKGVELTDSELSEIIKEGKTKYGFHSTYAKGGNADVENNEMVLNNNKQIAHHTKELPNAIKGKKVPAWVVAKVNRSASDLSDATHYMDGQGESYANGGSVDDLLEFTIPTWAMTSLINGDDSGLEDEDIEKVNDFLDRVMEKYGNANFMLGDKSEETEFYYRNDIDGNMGGDVTTLYLRPSKQYANGGGVKLNNLFYENELINLIKTYDFKTADVSNLERITYSESENPFKLNDNVWIQISPKDDWYGSLIIVIEKVKNHYEIRIGKDTGWTGGLEIDSTEFAFDIPKLTFEEFKKGFLNATINQNYCLYSEWSKKIHLIGSLQEIKDYALQNGYELEEYGNKIVLRSKNLSKYNDEHTLLVSVLSSTQIQNLQNNYKNGGGVGKKSDRNETQENNFGVSYKLGDKFILGKKFGNNKDVEVSITEIMPSGLFFKVDKSDKTFSIKTLHSKGSTYTSGEYLIPIKKDYANGGVFEPYDEEKYSSEYDYLRKIITKNFGEKNRNFSSADWGGIDNWTIKGDMYEGIFIIIDDNAKVVLMERKHNEELEENEDTDILEAEVNDTKGLQNLFSKAIQIKENKMANGGGVGEKQYVKVNNINDAENILFYADKQDIPSSYRKSEKDGSYTVMFEKALMITNNMPPRIKEIIENQKTKYANGGGVESQYKKGVVLVKSAKASNDNDVWDILNDKWKKYKIVNSRAFDLETPYNRGWIDEGISINVYLLKDTQTNKYYWDSDYIEARKNKMAKGGGVGEYVDLFEDYENIPENIQAILDRYSEEFGGDGGDMDYQDTANMLKEVEAEGYTFGYYLDNEPYGLRPIGVRLNQLKGYEEFGDDEYAKGGRLTSNEDIIEAFLTSNREAKVGNLSTHYNEYDNQMLLRNYGTLIASRKGNNLNITSIKYSVTTTKITNMVNRMAKDKGLNVKYVEKFEDGGMTSSYCYEIGGL